MSILKETIQYWTETIHKNYTDDQISFVWSHIIGWKAIATIALAILAYQLSVKTFRHLYQPPYIEIIKKSLVPTLPNGMGGFIQMTFIEYGIFNPSAHEILIKDQSIWVFPIFKPYRFPKSSTSVKSYGKRVIRFPLEYKKIDKLLGLNIARIKIIDVKNRKATKWFIFNNQ